MGISVYPDSI